MSSPMTEVPEHCPISVNSSGQGPETDLREISWWVCWCSDPQCQLFQVSGDDYREAIEKLRDANIKEPEHAVMVMIGLGWTRTGDGL